MIGVNERVDDPSVALGAVVNAAIAGLWTALPGIIQSFDSDAVTCTVQPAIQGIITGEDGSRTAVNLPLLVDVPVVFPRGGGATLTFPIANGDECLVVFSSRCIDAWWQSGGVQIPMESRKHDLSDGFALVGPMSQARKISGISTSTVQLRSDDGSAYVEIDPASHAVNVETSGNVSVNAGGNIAAEAVGTAAVTAPSITLNGNVTINGTLTQTGGGTATFSGNIDTPTGDVTASGKSLKTHVHSGVTSGPSNTGQPV